jgi:hypothetical protein
MEKLIPLKMKAWITLNPNDIAALDEKTALELIERGFAERMPDEKPDEQHGR